MRAYLELTKPSIMLLVTFTGAAALIVLSLSLVFFGMQWRGYLFDAVPVVV